MNFNLKQKKSLGQIFLTSQAIVNKIVVTADIKDDEIVLEAGPGKGILTQALLEKAGKVISVEKDIKLLPFLREKFAKEIEKEKLILVYGDILTFNFQFYKLNNYKIVANIPYYITGEFLRKTLSSYIQPNKMVLLIQKEVAERIARTKKESILSISVKAYGEPKYIQTVKAGNFKPAPKVDSAILEINNISKEFFIQINEKKFFEIVKAGFAHKRKFLISNLGIFAEKEKLKLAFKQAGVSDTARAEDIALEQWKILAQQQQ